jgi:hypothetical protein
VEEEPPEDSEDAREVGSEDESDLELEDGDALDAVVLSTDWTAETLLGQIARGNIALDPVFQRRDAWDRPRKSRFIESLVVGLPVPQVVLAEKPGERGAFIVLDGKQRLLTLSQFAEGSLQLRRLELRPDLNGRYYEDLPSEERNAFDNQTIRTVVVRNWKSDKFLYAVFLRLNTGNLPLSPQELRTALHPGAFVQFTADFTAGSDAFKAMLNLTKPDFRMRDAELLVRYFAYEEFLPAYGGNLKPFLDMVCERLNESWDASANDEIRRRAEACEEGIKATLEIFGDNAFRRWNQTKYERPFNRAVFDVMLFYFRMPEVRAAALDHADAVASAFQEICGEPEFTEALSRTTKTIDAIYLRLSRWGEALGDVVGKDLPVPGVHGGRLHYG